MQGVFQKFCFVKTRPCDTEDQLESDSTNSMKLLQ